jgi:photosystem II stability/assembly factor-like uncharacterized protein
MRLAPIALLAVSAAGLTWGQGRGPVTPPPPPVNPSTDPLLRPFEFRSIGPATMMGRVDDIAGAEKDPLTMYVGFATGGLFKSIDGGNHWKPLWDEQENNSVGAIGIAPSDPNIVYVGTGEANNRQSSSIGNGMWGTTDGGKTWTHLGLEDTQAIGRVVVDPTNPKIVFAAVMGHLFGPNPDRGLYKTIDGGKTWKKAKFIDNNTGFNDVAIDFANPKVVYATSYSRLRTWWGYNGGSTNSGLWKSTDGGETWAKLEGAGWPKPKDGLYGRIAISLARSKPGVIYAQVEAGASAGTGGGTTAEGGPARGGRGGAGNESAAAEAAAPGGVAPPGGAAPAAGAAVAQGGGQFGGGQGRGGRGGPPPPPDPNKSGVFRSDDGGKTWTLMSNQNDRPMYFSQIRADPNDDQRIFVGGNPGQASKDGGKTWTPIQGSHTDFHAFWINPKDSRIMWIGHDGGIDASYDGGQTWDYHNDFPVGQFYQVSADMRRPYYVCGGLQDNNAWCGPSAVRSSVGPVNGDWYTVAGGDGFYTRQDPTDWAIVYGESQDGNMSRHDLRTGAQKSIRPNVTVAGGRGGAAAQTAATTPTTTTATGEAPANPAPGNAPGAAAAAAGGGAAAFGGGGGRGAPNVTNAPPNVDTFRFYWNAPFEISPHNPAVVYMAAQYFFKSTNRGDSWWMNKQDLTKNINRWAADMPIMGVPGDKPMASKHDGYAASSTATQVRESPSRPGVLWIGTEDGNLQVSQDGGENFTNVIGNVTGAPKGYTHISRIEPSHFDPGTAYVAIDNHRNDDWKPYLFKTTDYGKTWTSVVNNLPAKGPINALREDYDNPNLLFVGTEFGLYVTLNQGREWKKFMTGLPNVRVDDILIHPRDRDLIVATHARSFFIADDITPLEQMKAPGSSDITLFEPRPAVQWKTDRAFSSPQRATNREFKGTNPQGGTAIHIWANSDLGAGKLEFLQGTTVVSTMDVNIKAGMNRFQWAMRGVPVVAGAAGAGRGGRGGRGAAAALGAPAAAGGEAAPAATPAATPAVAGAPGQGGFGGGGGRGGLGTGVPFVSGGGGGGGFGGGFGGAAVTPGSYMVKLTVGSQTQTTSVTVLEDTWMHVQ